MLIKQKMIMSQLFARSSDLKITILLMRIFPYLDFSVLIYNFVSFLSLINSLCISTELGANLKHIFYTNLLFTSKIESLLLYYCRSRKNFPMLLEEEQSINPEGPNYLSIQAPASKFPERKLCSVCGHPAPYTCIPCGSRFCCKKCLVTHEDTRCLKYTS
ncbi:Zinc finger HIT domain-containing protein 1 [Armadillidium nasatum]|uniref:Zinc finger HIT domain-containing protein 1 n=1 Tax=Armadillidium nasatum TaxID=96803 RepID=A0A5N5SJX7_9CRUS|nr:Zinc finger HIT domain-containing protein 1 [Armadillidium nasatum]